MQIHTKTMKLYRLDFTEEEMKNHVLLLVNSNPPNPDVEILKQEQLSACKEALQEK